jgi:flagellar motor switch protein FliN
MSTGAAPTLASELLDYARAWAKSIAAAQPTPGAICEVFLQAPASAAPPKDDDLWISAFFPGEFAGAVALRIGQASVRQFMQVPAREPAEAVGELNAEQQAALLDWLRNAAAGVAANMQRKEDAQIQVAFSAAPPDDTAATFWLELRTGDLSPMVLELRLDSATVRGLQSMSPALLSSKPAAADMAAAKLGMLMEVELVVAVRFGGRRMLLKDILDLCAGSVVELDQHVQEPVDLLLDGRLIARGEVVVVDGNYGLRVTEVLSNAAK